MAESLYDRLGGEAAILAAVNLFYEKVMADELLRPFFADLDMDAQIVKQIAFMTWAFGGPVAQRGRDLRSAHAALVARGLDDRHFDAVLDHLRQTLLELGVNAALVAESLAIVEAQRDPVLGRG